MCLNKFLSAIFENVNVDNKMYLTCDRNEPIHIQHLKSIFKLRNSPVVFNLPFLLPCTMAQTIYLTNAYLFKIFFYFSETKHNNGYILLGIVLS